MRRKREYVDYLRDIVEAAEKAQEFVGEKDFEEFESDDRTTFAVIRALEIIGEAAKHIPPHVRQEYADIPWREMAGMRDKVIHGYFGVNLRRVFDTVHQDLPALRTAVGRLLQDMGGEQDA